MSVPIIGELKRVMDELRQFENHPYYYNALIHAKELTTPKIIGYTINTKTGEKKPLTGATSSFMNFDGNPLMSACVQYFRFTEIFDKYLEEEKQRGPNDPPSKLANYTMAESARKYDEFIEANKW